MYPGRPTPEIYIYIYMSNQRMKHTIRFLLAGGFFLQENKYQDFEAALPL